MSASQITIEQWHTLLKAQNVKKEQLQFICPKCKTVQSPQDFIDAGLAEDEWQSYIAFSCVGRFVENKGCNWTLGGLFQIAELFVIDEDGEKHPRFKPVNFEDLAGAK